MSEELEGLREAINDVSTSIVRVELLRLAVLFLLPITLVGAFDRLNSKNPEAIRKAISDNDSTTGTVHMSGDPLHNPFWKGEISFDSPKTIPEYSPDVRRARDESRGKYEQLKGIYQDAFAQKLSIFGAETNVDLRIWIYILPIGLILTQIYLFLLRRKRELLTFAARRKDPGASILNRLIFNGEGTKASRFSSYPTRSLEHISATMTIGLLIYLGVASYPFWQDWISADDLANSFISPLIVLVSCAIYAAVYSEHVSRRLTEEVRAATGAIPPESVIGAIYNRLRAWAAKLTQLLRPRISLGIGSLLLLASLFLATGMDSCGEPEAGYKLALGRATWFSSVLSKDWAAVYAQRVGVEMYRLALFFALVTAGCLAFKVFSRPDLWNGRRWLRAAGGFAVFLLMFVLCEYSFTLYLSDTFNAAIVLGHSIWMITSLVLIVHLYRPDLAEKKKWLILVRCLALFWVPILLANLLPLGMMIWYVFNRGEGVDLKGLLSFYLAAILLTLGYVRLLRETQTAAFPSESSPAPAEGAGGPLMEVSKSEEHGL
jgi:hypothetical protein